MIASARLERPKAVGCNQGFTLIEVLIATVLSATLMLGIWSLLNVYIGLFEDGDSKSEQAQLVRALMQQLTDDLHGAIQDPIPGLPTRPLGPTPVRRFGLFGTQSELRFDVLQITPFQGSLTPGAEDGLSRQLLRAPELRTVYYRFEQSGGLTGDNTVTQPGLSRRELDFETPYPEEADSGFGSLGSPPTQTLDVFGDLAGASSGGLLVVDPNDDSIMLAPEVVDCHFRYFDGSTWSSGWNSLQRKSLPVAVEVTMQVSSLQQRERSFVAEGVEDFGQLDGLGPDALESEPTIYPIHRLVIDIPGAPMHSAPKRVRGTVRLKPRIVPRTPPRVRPAKPPKPANLPDQWMRTER